MLERVTLAQKFATLAGPWQPAIVAELNGQHVKAVRIEGEFVWHQHEHADELFLVLRGHIRICLRDGDIELGPGEMAMIPRGVEHKPVADEAADVLLFEPAGTRNTGNVIEARTVEPDDLPRI